MKKRKEKIAIIMSGGGMMCSYGVGAILALVEKYCITQPDIVITGSGGAGTMSYYVAEQYSSIRNIWSNLLSTKKFIDFKRYYRVIDIDYLIDDVFKVQDPLNENKIKKSKIDYFIAVTNYDNGKVEYFSSRNKESIFETMRATMALPMVYRKKIRINNNNYCDSYNSSAVELNVLKAIELGAEKIIVINNDISLFINNLAINLWVLCRNKEFRKNYHRNREFRRTFSIPKNTKIISLHPTRNLKVSTLNNSQKALKETIKQGYDETVENHELKIFLKGK